MKKRCFHQNIGENIFLHQGYIFWQWPARKIVSSPLSTFSLFFGTFVTVSFLVLLKILPFFQFGQKISPARKYIPVLHLPPPPTSSAPMMELTVCPSYLVRSSLMLASCRVRSSVLRSSSARPQNRTRALNMNSCFCLLHEIDDVKDLNASD